MTDNPLSILIIDDEPAEIRLLVDTLEDYGFNLIVALTGEEGLFSARSALPDLILLDLRMPPPDGFEVCRELKNEAPLQHIPVIIITAMHDAKSAVQAFRLGASDYITKPIDISEVLARVTLHLDQSRMEMPLTQRLEAYHRKSSNADSMVSAETIQGDLQGVARVKEYMLTHLANPISLEELTRIAHSNRTSLSKNFRVLHGMSLFEWLREQRLQTAAHLLSNSRMQIQQIALETCYATTAALSKAFKRRFSMSPIEYRQSSINYKNHSSQN